MDRLFRVELYVSEETYDDEESQIIEEGFAFKAVDFPFVPFPGLLYDGMRVESVEYLGKSTFRVLFEDVDRLCEEELRENGWVVDSRVYK